MPVVTLIVDPKARVVIVVERAQADGATCRRFQVNVLGDKLQRSKVRILQRGCYEADNTKPPQLLQAGTVCCPISILFDDI